MPNFTFKATGQLLQDTFNQWLEVNATRMGAALSYYSVFSLGPLLIISIAVASFFFGDEAARGQIFEQLRGTMGDGGAQAVEALVKGAQKNSTGETATLLSIITLFVGATGVVVQLKDALNAIWNVRPKPGKTLKVFFHNYLISVGALVGLGFILMASLILSTIIQWFGFYLSSLLPFPKVLITMANQIFSFASIAALFAIIFKVLPDVAIRWSDVWLGALGTALMFIIGKSMVALYLGQQSLESSYGAASSVLVIMIWVFYLSQVLLFGAAFTRAYTLSQHRILQLGQDVEIAQTPDSTKTLRDST